MTEHRDGAPRRLVLGEYVRMGGILRRVISRNAEIARVQTVSSGAIRDVPREELPPTFVISPSARYRKTRVTILEYLDDDMVLIGVHRSEEHTSELQSRENLVCRLLLEKK